MTAPYIPRAPGVNPQPPQPVQGLLGPPPQSRSIFDRIGSNLFGTGGLDDATRAQANRQGLLGIGTSLLRSSGPSTTPVGLGQAIGEAIPQGQAQAFQASQDAQALQAQQTEAARAQQRQEILAQSGGDPSVAYRSLLQMGDVEGAAQVADMMSKTQTEGSRLQFIERDDGSIVALDPTTGEEVNRIALGEDGQVMTLSSDQANRVDGIRDDLIRNTGELYGQANAFGRVQSAAIDMREAVASGDRSKASAAALSLVIGYGKLLDPESIVREGEVRTIMAQGSATQKIESLVQGFMSGTLSMDIMESIIRQSGLQLLGAQDNIQPYLRAAEQRLEDAGIDSQFLRAPDAFSRHSAAIERARGIRDRGLASIGRPASPVLAPTGGVLDRYRRP